METIERPHEFTDRLNHIRRGKRYFYLKHEKDIYPIKIERTHALDNAFIDKNWKAFEGAESKYYTEIDMFKQHRIKPGEVFKDWSNYEN